jgi:hypothetical protein
MEFRINVKGLDKIQAMMKELPPKLAKVGIKAFAEWILGNGERGLRAYQPYKYITRRKAYGQTFVSDKQRRYVMAMIREGKIDPGAPHRTGQTQRGWYARPSNSAYKYNIGNETPGAYYTRHETGQARLNELAGWKKAGAIIAKEMAGAIRAANKAIREAIKKG